MKPVFFVTGTDTDAGKTLVTTALLCACKEKQLKALGMKPVAAGGSAGGSVNEDALSLQRYSSSRLACDQVNPFFFAPAIAPHIAADQSGVPLDASRVIEKCRAFMDLDSDVIFIEGAGGWRVPLNETENFSDVVKGIGCEVILVVGLKLGCLNHAILTAEAIASDGLKLAGWVGSVCSGEPMRAFSENVATLKARMPCDCLGVIPFIDSPAPECVAKDYISLPFVT
ncbi:MAG: dethiobiotin synthase [Proteobacteria bacterium]|nr:MAG: dethiobiotin synthase [Pseudomonadota bacterium]